MYARVPDDFIAKLRERVDIVDVVSEHVRLTRSGRSFVGLCPFHSEKSPSFHVTPGKGFYHCFGCGAGGTAITFLMEVEQITFREAVERLANKAGLTLPVVADDFGTDPGNERRLQMLQAHDLAAKFYNHIVMNLDAGMQGLSYFLHRGLTKKTIAQYNLGFAPRSGTALLQFLEKRGLSRDILTEAGLCVVTDRGDVIDRFRGRVMFPVWDLQGRVIAFGARALGPEQPKYLNSPESPLFSKGRSLYGYHRARQAIRQAGQVLLLEGYMDVLALHQSGIHHAVAALGTALTPEQAGLLNRVADTVVLVYDGDEAGQKAAKRNLDVCKEAGVVVRVAVVPEGKDPDEWVRERGVESFRSDVLGQSMSGLTFELKRLTKSYPHHLTSERMAYLRDAVSVVAREDSALERESVLEELARTYGISVQALRDDVNKAMTQQAVAGVRTARASARGATNLAASQAPLLERHVVAARQLLAAMMVDREVVRAVQERFTGEFPGALESALQAYIYTFYDERDEADPEWLVSNMDDPEIIHFAAQLLHAAEDWPLGDEIQSDMIDDDIECLIHYELEQSIAPLEERMKLAVEASDFAALSELQAEYMLVRQQMVGADRASGTFSAMRERRNGR
ncbi:MAG: DNA primase [Firmicutes bacterium]|nr:DNA primase [Bacillota bacterium]